MQQQQATMPHSEWGLFYIGEKSVPPQFTDVPWDGEFADFAINHARIAGHVNVLQQATRDNPLNAVCFSVSRREAYGRSIFKGVVMPDILLPILRDVIVRMDGPVHVTVNEEPDARDFRPSLDLPVLLRDLNVESAFIQKMTLTAQPSPEGGSSWALHPLRKMTVNRCNFADIDRSRLAVLVPQCTLEVFDV